MASEIQSLQDALAILNRMIQETSPLVIQAQRKMAETRGQVNARLSGAQGAGVVNAHLGRAFDMATQQLGALARAREEIKRMINQARNI
jgi:uncharacterized protein involved in exopolysaccharide biosynthesis